MPKKVTVEVPDEISPEQLDIESVLDDLGSSVAICDLYRMTREGRRAYKDRIALDLLKANPQDYIRTEYGSGRWLLIFKDSSNRYVGSKVVEIDPEGKEASTNPGGAAPSAGSANTHVEFLREQMALQNNLIMALIGKGNTGPDVGTLLAGLAAMLNATKGKEEKQIDMTAILTALRPPDPSNMLSAVIAAFTALKGNTDDKDFFEKASQLIGLARDLVPGGVDGSGKNADGPWDVVSEVGKHLADRFLPGNVPGARPALNSAPDVSGAGADAGRVSSVSTDGGSISTPPGGGGSAAAAGGDEHMMQWIKAGLEYLKKKAALGKDPSIYTAQILDNPEELQWQALIYAIEGGATFEHLLTFDNEIAQNPLLKEWFSRLYNELHADIFDNEDTGRTTGNVDHVAGNETPSITGDKPSGSGGTRKRKAKSGGN